MHATSCFLRRGARASSHPPVLFALVLAVAGRFVPLQEEPRSPNEQTVATRSLTRSPSPAGATLAEESRSTSGSMHSKASSAGSGVRENLERDVDEEESIRRRGAESWRAAESRRAAR